MPVAPDLAAVKAYLTAAGLSVPEDAVLQAAYDAEKDDQAARCRIPADANDFPPALAEALCRRVAHNIALRPLSLGVQAVLTDGVPATTPVGGNDAEVNRLERPRRKRVVG